MWMSHTTHVNVSCHTYKWGMSHMSHVTHVNESCHTCEWVLTCSLVAGVCVLWSNVWTTYNAHMCRLTPNESAHVWFGRISHLVLNMIGSTYALAHMCVGWLLMSRLFTDAHVSRRTSTTYASELIQIWVGSHVRPLICASVVADALDGDLESWWDSEMCKFFFHRPTRISHKTTTPFHYQE